MATLNSHLDRFLRERIYLKNVSPKTRVWYETAWKTFVRTQVPDFGTRTIDSPQAITRQHLQEFVVALRDRGVRPVTVNTWLCALNAFCRWLHDEGTLAEPVRLKRLKVERRLVKTLDEAALRGILSFRPKDYSQWRVQTAVATIIDTGSGESRRPGGASNRAAGFASSRWIFMMSYSGPIMDTPPPVERRVLRRPLPPCEACGRTNVHVATRTERFVYMRCRDCFETWSVLKTAWSASEGSPKNVPPSCRSLRTWTT